jgi:hypothetical protein
MKRLLRWFPVTWAAGTSIGAAGTSIGGGVIAGVRRPRHSECRVVLPAECLGLIALALAAGPSSRSAT